jgi:hypothetical protein
LPISKRNPSTVLTAKQSHMTPISSLTGQPFAPSPLVNHPAAALNFTAAPTPELRDAFELIRKELVASPNQSSYAAVPHLSSLFSYLKQAC